MDEKQAKKTEVNEPDLMISELELNEEEVKIYEQLKSTLIDKCGLMEFEAVDMSKKDDYAAIILYISNKRAFLENDGIIIKLRNPLKNEKGDILTDHVKMLFERNTARENQFVKGKKIKDGDIALQKDYSRAALAASLANIDKDGRSIVLSPNNIGEKHVHPKDYSLMMSCYNFFRN